MAAVRECRFFVFFFRFFFFFFFFFGGGGGGDFYGELGIYVMEGRGRDGIRSGVTSIVNVTIMSIAVCFMSEPMTVLNTLAIKNSF